MSPEQYHRILTGLDEVLEVFKAPGVNLSPEDQELRLQLVLARAHSLRAESGHPFPSQPPSPRVDPDLTIAPFRTKPPFPSGK